MSLLFPRSGASSRNWWVLAVFAGIAFSSAIAFGFRKGAAVHLSPAPLCDGDLIFVRGSSFRTVAVLAADRGDYSHVGIIVRDADGYQVIHASPEGPGGHTVVAQPLADFLAMDGVRAAAVYRVTDPQILTEAAARVATLARSYSAQRVPFDDAFDLGSADSLYCTELVWRAYLEVGVDLCENRITELDIPLFHRKVILPSALLMYPGLELVSSSR